MNTITKFCLLSAVVLLSCSKTNKHYSFESIDYSSFCGYYFNYIKIFNNGTIYLAYDYKEAYEHKHDSIKYYTYTLNKSQFDTLSKLVEKVYEIKIEPRYDLGMDSGLTFSLIINSKLGILTTAYNGPWSLDSLKPLIDFVTLLTKISNNVRASVDSSFVFESRSKLVMPFPPLQEIK
jgi:hypothetical protein